MPKIVDSIFHFIPRSIVFCLLVVLAFSACKDSKKPPEKDVVKTPDQLEERTAGNLRKLLDYASGNNSRVNDSISLRSLSLLKMIYSKNDFKTIWSHEDSWHPVADSLFQMLDQAREYGLFPSDYNLKSLVSIRRTIQNDTVSRRDAALWTRADILLTEAFLDVAKDLKLGRLPKDSTTLRQDSLLNDDFFISTLNQAVANKKIIESLQALEPSYPGYRQIREGIRNFLDSAEFSNYTYINYPTKDSMAFVRQLQQRLSEDGHMAVRPASADSIAISSGIASYQQSINVKVTGKISEALVRSLNNTDWEKFKTIAVNLDRYKQLAEKVPETYVMVNLPAYKLYVYDADTIVFQSKVIIGAPKTRTPLLTSRISNFILFPQWTVPYSIVFKEMLPKIQKNTNYLAKQNLMVVDRNENVIDPETIDWASLNNKKFPYLLRQKEGDENSLGIIKFNFVNKYSVYLHDTNARWLFSKSVRALSHGCVRVQQWEELSRYLTSSDTLRFPPDSLKTWIEGQEKHVVTGFPRMPLFIRYFTVEGGNGKLKFFSDVYDYDRITKERYFSKKAIG